MAELQLMEDTNKKLEELRKKKRQAQVQFDKLSNQSLGGVPKANGSAQSNIQYNAEKLGQTTGSSIHEDKVWLPRAIYEWDEKRPIYISAGLWLMGCVRNIPALSNARDQQP